MSPKKVAFSDVTILSFPVILGDNPAVRNGAPIELDWKPSERNVEDIDLFDFMRLTERKPRKKLAMSAPRRTEMLLTAGYSMEEIAMAAIAAEQVKQERIETSRTNGFNNSVLNVLQKTGQMPMNVVKGMLSLTKSKQNSLSARSA